MTSFRARALPAVLFALGLGAATQAAAQQQLNVICSVQGEWCNAIATEFQRETGIKVAITPKGSGESIAQLAAEKANPKLDVWFGGTGDPHLQAAEQGLTEEYKSPLLKDLQPWAQKQAEQSKYRTVGIYLGVLGIGYNTELLAKKKAAAPACWKDLIKPEYAGEVQMANPNASGTAYTAIATLVQVFGEEEAFKYLLALHKNINNYPRSGVAPIKAVARGETMVSVSFIHDVVTEAQADFPVKSVAPCEGTGYEIGSLSIVKGARNLDAAKKFVDWALTPKAQTLGAGQQAVPDAVERQHPAVAAVAEDRRHQAHQLRLRQVRRVGRAQAPARALGQRSRLGRPLTALVHMRVPAVCGRHRAHPESTACCTASPPSPRCRSPSSPPLPAAGQGQLNLYCSSPNTAWCQGMAVGFEKATGTKVAVIQKATGEMLAQIKAERANPKGDIWWAGPGDTYLQAAEEGLLETYRSPNLAQLHDWAQRITEVSKNRVAGVYGGILSLGYNTELQAKKKLPVPAVLEGPARPRLQGRGDARQSRIPRAPRT